MMCITYLKEVLSMMSSIQSHLELNQLDHFRLARVQVMVRESR
jgi:hypothetical protein